MFYDRRVQQCTVGAIGKFVLPALIFPRKRMNHLFFKHTPIGDLTLITEICYMNVFFVGLKNFNSSCQAISIRSFLVHSRQSFISLFIFKNFVLLWQLYTFFILSSQARHIMKFLGQWFPNFFCPCLTKSILKLWLILPLWLCNI